MTNSVAQTIAALLSDLRATLGAAPDPAVLPMLEALESGRYHFIRETWHDLKSDLLDRADPVRGELLLRATTPDGVFINPDDAGKLITAAGAYAAFDSIIVLAAVDQAIRQNELPVSINISGANAADGNSLFGFHDLLRAHFGAGFNPASITFEFLEDAQADRPDHLSLHDMRLLGYKFAIDDQSHEDWDRRRPVNLGPYVEYIKIDGKTLDAFRKGAIDLFEFTDFIARLKKSAPQAEFLCEWVSSPDEAEDLSRIIPAIRFVQGRDLHSSEALFAADIETARQRPGNRFTPGPDFV